MLVRIFDITTVSHKLINILCNVIINFEMNQFIFDILGNIEIG